MSDKESDASSKSSQSDKEEVNKNDEYSTSSSEDEDEIEDIDEIDIKLSQMRKAAKEKGTNRVRNRLEGLKSYDEVLREHTLTRMKEGLTKILSMHTPAELSSICGVLKLKTLQQGQVSVKQLLDYASVNGVITEDKVNELFAVMWDGALIEYIRSIGHPVSTQFIDPKITIMQIWSGGDIIYKNNSSFTPHFVVREIKKRYAWIKSDDIQSRLEILREKEAKVKISEKAVISDHDFTNILTYFKQMSDLRKTEESTREYLISELEIARSKIDQQQSIVKISQEDLRECEDLSMKIVSNLNYNLATSEALCTAYVNERNMIEMDLQRMILVIESYKKCLTDRDKKGYIDGSNANTLPLQLVNAEESVISMKQLHDKTKDLYDYMTQQNNLLREKASIHASEVEDLRIHIRNLEGKLSESYNQTYINRVSSSTAQYNLTQLNKQNVTNELNREAAAATSWNASIRCMLQYNDLKGRMKTITPLILAGYLHYHPEISSICEQVIIHMQLLSSEDFNMTKEKVLMSKEDEIGRKLRKRLGGGGGAGKKRSSVVKKPSTPNTIISSVGRASITSTTSSVTASDAVTTDSKNKKDAAPIGSPKAGSKKVAKKADDKSSPVAKAKKDDKPKKKK